MGIDPGLADVGYGVIETNGHVLTARAWGNLKTKKYDNLSSRLMHIYDGINALIEKYRPHVVAVEELFFYKNEKTAINVSHARGVILLAVARAGVSIKEFTPLEVKQTTAGHGHADKKQVQKMLMLSLNLSTPPTPDDAADALAVALTASTNKAIYA